MVWIQISGEVNGKARLYLELQQGGQYCYVPTYKAYMSFEDGTGGFLFSVTRDASDIVFGNRTERFGTNGECPPSRIGKPYCATLHNKSDAIPFGLRLYEPEYRNQFQLRGDGNKVRSGILFHHGPARTEGCFTVAGGRHGFAAWRRKLEQMLELRPNTSIKVWVEPRPKSHHEVHLTRARG